MTRARVCIWVSVLVAAGATGGRAEGAALKGTITGADGAGVANAVVMVDAGAVPIAAAAPHVAIVQRDDTFVPHVVAVQVGTTVDFPNQDPRLHNVHSTSPAKTFDLGMYDRGESKGVLFDAPGVVRIRCNVHPKMEAFVVVHPNPWVAVTDARGSYEIAGVPAGSHPVRVWVETLAAPVERHVTVHEGQVEHLDVRLAP
ncbi:MAG TPA: carboxypeptidase regulatory-like domain-containing protein [Candidatus Binatia bacterium]|jgi:plastocyanin|nr:carboxypeptidase regulatory-like domain-containing protein [Candidatus Binatia bacterium]